MVLSECGSVNGKAEGLKVTNNVGWRHLSVGRAPDQLFRCSAKLRHRKSYPVARTARWSMVEGLRRKTPDFWRVVASLMSRN